MKTMRDVLIEGISKKMVDNEYIYFLSADFGSPALDRLKVDFHDRFINVGIAEQNLVNVAVGLALEGFTVYAYAIAPFLTMRAYEQIRINLSMLSQIREINVNLIGVGIGLSYDVTGPTHHCLEDLSIIRTLPNITIFSPSDFVLTERFIDYSLDVNKPKYIRLDGKPLPKIYETKNVVIEEGFYELQKGENVCIVSTGYMTHKAISLAHQLIEIGINVGLIDVFLIKPFVHAKLYNKLKKYKHIVTIEESFIGKGGLDSLLSEVLREEQSPITMTTLGFRDEYIFNVGDREYLHAMNGLDKTNLIGKIEKLYISL